MFYYSWEREGGNFFSLMDETGQVKTDLGECDFKVTNPDNEC